jgi:integrase
MKDLIFLKPEIQFLSDIKEIQKLSNLTMQISRSAKSDNTLNGYASDWEDFQAWCDAHQCQSLPASPHIVAAYISDRATNNWEGPSGRLKKMTMKAPLKLPTLLHRIWGIRFKHKENGLHFDTSSKEIANVLEGLRRMNIAKEERKTPLLLEDLRKISEQLQLIIDAKEKDPIKVRIAIRDRALLNFGFISAMRRAEIATLNMKDIKFVENGIEVHIMQSKTGERELVVPYGSNPFTCPVRSLKAWLQEAGITEGPVFRAVTRHGHVSADPLAPYSIALIIQGNDYIKSKTEEAKIKGQKVPSYGGHSLRAGFVTTAITEGVPEDLIMAQTGHKKRDTLDKYIRRTNKWVDSAATRIGI